jgi:hypothetical protein
MTVGGAEAAVPVVADGTDVGGAVARSRDVPAGTEAGALAVTPGEAASPGVPDAAGAAAGVALVEAAGTDAVAPAPAEHAEARKPQATSATSPRARGRCSWLMGESLRHSLSRDVRGRA